MVFSLLGAGYFSFPPGYLERHAPMIGINAWLIVFYLSRRIIPGALTVKIEESFLEPRTIQDFLGSAPVSEMVRKELVEGKNSTLEAWLWRRMLSGKINFTPEDYGAAVAWLIKHFPLTKGQNGWLVNEDPYKVFMETLSRFDLYSKISWHGDLNYGLMAMMGSFLTLPAGAQKIDMVREFVGVVGREKSLAFVRTINSISIWRPADLDDLSDPLLMGQEAIEEAIRQGWYERDRSFVRHHIVRAQRNVKIGMELFVAYLKKQLKNDPVLGLKLPSAISTRSQDMGAAA